MREHLGCKERFLDRTVVSKLPQSCRPGFMVITNGSTVLNRRYQVDRCIPIVVRHRNKILDDKPVRCTLPT